MRMFNWIGKAFAFIITPIVALVPGVLTYLALHASAPSIIAFLLHAGVASLATGYGSPISAVCFTLAAVIAIGTMVQAAPPIWNKLSYWGQKIDEKIHSWWTKQKPVLDIVGEYYKESNKLIHSVTDKIAHVSLEMPFIQNDIENLFDLSRIASNQKAELEQFNVVKEKYNQILMGIRNEIQNLPNDLKLADNLLDHAADNLRGYKAHSLDHAQKDAQLGEKISENKYFIVMILQELRSLENAVKDLYNKFFKHEPMIEKKSINNNSFNSSINRAKHVKNNVTSTYSEINSEINKHTSKDNKRTNYRKRINPKQFPLKQKRISFSLAIDRYRKRQYDLLLIDTPTSDSKINSIGQENSPYSVSRK